MHLHGDGPFVVVAPQRRREGERQEGESGVSGPERQRTRGGGERDGEQAGGRWHGVRRDVLVVSGTQGVRRLECQVGRGEKRDRLWSAAAQNIIAYAERVADGDDRADGAEDKFEAPSGACGPGGRDEEARTLSQWYRLHHAERK